MCVIIKIAYCVDKNTYFLLDSESSSFKNPYLVISIRNSNNYMKGYFSFYLSVIAYHFSISAAISGTFSGRWSY